MGRSLIFSTILDHYGCRWFVINKPIGYLRSRVGKHPHSVKKMVSYFLWRNEAIPMFISKKNPLLNINLTLRSRSAK